MNGSSRLFAAFEIAIVLAVFVSVKAAFDPYTWKYSSVIAGFTTLAAATLLLHFRKDNWSNLGLRLRGPTSLRAFFVTTGQILIIFVVSVGLGYAAALLAGLYFERPPETDDRFGDLAGNLPLFLWWLLIAWSLGGFMEEMVFRGYLITKLETAFAGGAPKRNFSPASIAAVVVSALLFGLVHLYYRGAQGAISLAVVGLILGLFYLAFNRTLWPLIITHGGVNSLAILGRYLGQDW